MVDEIHDADKTYFGNRIVDKNDKVNLVKDVFNAVAPKYDLMNDVLSLGIHRVWKSYLIKQIAPMPQMVMVDVAGGTGDMTFEYLEYIKKEFGTNAANNVTVIDINQEMLKVGQQRALKRGYGDLKFEEMNAEKLDLESNSVDVYMISYGIRNCTNIPQVLKEAYRVLKTGGRFVCLEFSHVENPILNACYEQYSQFIPKLGSLVANDAESYAYLTESIQRFPKQLEFQEMIEDAGFRATTYENLMGGISAIHSGYKI